MESRKVKRTLSYLLLGQEGGENRFKIIEMLRERPYNINQIAEQLDLNYKTVKHHVDVMIENGILTSSKEGDYGKVYFLEEKVERNIEVYEDIVEKFEKFTASPALLKNLLKQSDVGLIIADEEGKTTFLNKGAEKIFGYSEKETLGKPLEVFEDEESTKKIFQKVDDEGKLKEERKIKKKSGETTHINLIVESIFDEDDEFIGYSILAVDISERKEIEKEKEEQYNVLQAIMENTDSQLVYLDKGFNFVYVNSAYAEAAGYTREELLGENHFELFPDEENKKIFEKVRDTGEPVTYHDKPFEYPDDPERGTTYWNWNLALVKDDQGEVQGLVLSLMETTERVKQEKKIKEKNERIEFLKSLITSIKDVNELLLKEDDFDRIVEEVPSILLSTQGFTNITLALFEEDDIMRPISNSGDHESRSWKLTRNGEGDAPGCVKKALETQKKAIVDEIEESCKGCPFSEEMLPHQTAVIPIKVEGSILGMIRACYEPEVEIDERTLELLHDVEDDLAYALKEVGGENN
ncbi:MAG: PAS domain S-box protein [Candidatus Thermoplasmatota archaeon]|nr:PAS domain S-box protein [Candidatus Thermoplasmatota archaeon]